MKKVLPLSVLMALLLLSFSGFAQLQISFPSTRAVFQRNLANNATVSITGTYNAAITRVEARMVARGGQGVTTDWQTIVVSPQGGVFNGQLTAQGGWYDLDVRLMRNDQEIALRRVERVGVGEVFVIAGQSNAGNIALFDKALNQERILGQSAQDDRVNCVKELYEPNYPNEPAIPQFSHVDSPNGIAPRGLGPWCWGMVGDELVRRLNVPVMFFNASFEGTSAKNWAETAVGQFSRSLFGPFNNYQEKHPYYPLQLSLQYYANMLGCRAVLWHQGEAENFHQLKGSDYIGWMRTVIGQTRSDYSANLSWVVSRATYFDARGIYPEIRQAQQALIDADPIVFAGPDTDTIQIPRLRDPNREDIVHFSERGLPNLARAWSQSLDNTFFQNATPIQGAAAPAISVACGANNTVSLTVNNYDNVVWDSGDVGKTITRAGGITLRGKAKNSQGRTVFTPPITISSAPSIQAIGETTFCQGRNVTLSSSFGQDNIWSDGRTDQRITVNTSGEYQVRYNDASGCTFTSNTIRVTVNPLPAQPIVAADRSATLCQGETIALTSSPANRYNWSNGQTDQRINVGQAGSFNLTVTDANGCTSPASAPVFVTVNPVPATPQLTINGRTTFCANESVTLNSSEGLGYVWSNGQSTRSVTVNQSGTYSVQTRNEFNCTSARSNAVDITVNPLPARPIISNERPTTFCQGESTLLTASQGFRYNWSNGFTDQSQQVSQSGSFSLTVTDQNGCTSPASAVVNVVANPLPATPVLTAAGRTTFCADQSVTLTSTEDAGYVWTSGQGTRSISVNESGTYSVRTRNQFNCTSASSNAINVTVNPLPNPPAISARGSLTFCEGSQLVLQTDSPLRTFWSTGDSTQTVAIRATGTYTARVRDANGCVSLNSNSLTTRTLPRPQPPTVRQAGTYLLEAAGAPTGERYFWQRGTDSLTTAGSLLRINQTGQYTARTQITYSPTLACLSLPSALLAYVLPTDNQDVGVYPNPSPDGVILIETLADVTNAVVTVYTLSGQLVFRGGIDLLNERKQIDLRSVIPGTYVLNITADGLRVSKRILIGR